MSKKTISGGLIQVLHGFAGSILLGLSQFVCCYCFWVKLQTTGSPYLHLLQYPDLKVSVRIPDIFQPFYLFYQALSVTPPETFFGFYFKIIAADYIYLIIC